MSAKIVAHATHSIAKGVHIFKSDHAKSAHELVFSLSSACGRALKAARNSSTSHILRPSRRLGEGIRFSPTSDRNLLAEIPRAAAASSSASPNTTGKNGITSRLVVNFPTVSRCQSLFIPDRIRDRWQGSTVLDNPKIGWRGHRVTRIALQFCFGG